MASFGSSARRTTSVLEERSTARWSARTGSTRCQGATTPGTVCVHRTRTPSRTHGMSRNASAIPATTRNTTGCSRWAAGTASCACPVNSATTTRIARVRIIPRRTGWPRRIWTASAMPATGTSRPLGPSRPSVRTVLRIITALGKGMCSRAWPTRCPPHSRRFTLAAIATLAGKA